jgi:hypothetical protein
MVRGGGFITLLNDNMKFLKTIPPFQSEIEWIQKELILSLRQVLKTFDAE